MKKCSFCAEEIQDAAIKCKHCGSMLDKVQNKLYFKTSFLIFGFLCVGPLVLPLIWFNPRLNQKTKVIVSIVIVVLSFYLGIVFFNSMKSISKYYQQIKQLSF